MKQDEQTDLVPVNGDQVPMVQSPTPVALGVDLSTPAKLEAAIQQVENAMTYKERVLEIAIKTSRQGAIISQGDSPYFTEAECERILSLLGGGRITVMQPPTRSDDPDGHFGYVAMVEVSHPVLGTFSGFGSAHSSDKFLGTNRGESSRTLDQVDRHNIAQHAMTRAKGAAIRNMLGLSTLDWAQLESWGFNQSKSSRIEYKKGGRSSPKKAAAKKSSLSRAASRLYAICKKRFETIPYSELSEYASEQCGYAGEKVLEAPDDVLAEVVKAVENGIFDK